MIVRIIKLIMVILMVMGIGFSIQNFVTQELNALGKKDGYDLWVSGVNLCPYGGTDCDTDLGIFPDI